MKNSYLPNASDGRPAGVGPLTAPGLSTDLTPLLTSRRRGWEMGLPAFADPQLLAQGIVPPVIIAVGGGKGGVGKSLVSANLASRLALAGRKVVAVDLDVGGANLHTYFGVNTPSHNLADLMIYGRRSLSEIAVATGIDGVRLVAGGREEVWGGAASIEQSGLRRLFNGIYRARADMGADIVILDLGAGTNRLTIDFFTAAHLGLVTVLPEPTSIENAYLFLKTTLFHCIDNLGVRTGATGAADEIKNALLASERGLGGGRTVGYADRLKQLGQLYPGFVSQVATVLAGRVVGFSVNQTRCQQDIDIGRSMEVIGERYFGFSTRFCGYLNYDEAAWKSLRNRRLLIVDFPQSNLSRRFADLARTVLASLGF